MQKLINRLLFIYCFTYASASSLYPVHLTVEYLEGPQAVDDPNPRLSWILVELPDQNGPSAENKTQTAYQILVSSSADELGATKSDLWDSTKVRSDRTNNIRYQGKVLEPGQTAFWKVKVWDENDKSLEYSLHSTWTNALNETHWTGKWIRAPSGLQKQGLANLRPEDQKFINAHDGLKPVLLFRKIALIDLGDVIKAKLYVTAKGLYKAYFNGADLTSSNYHQPEMNPGWTDYNKTIQYQVYDVTSKIVDDLIVIGVKVATGWYSGYVGFLKGHSYYGKDEFLLVQLHIDYGNGTRLIICSDESWKVTTGSLIYADMLHGELLYEDRQVENWGDPLYNDSAWLPVVTEPLSKSVQLVAETSQQITITGYLKAKAAWQIGPNVWVYDFGLNFVGYVMIDRIILNDYSTVQVKHAEMLNPNGTIYTANLRSATATDTYVLANTSITFGYLKPQFTYHGFRYIEISGSQYDLSDYIQGVKIGVHEMITSSFRTDNALVNKLQKNIISSQISNLISVPTDCPQRDERLGWMADAQIFAPTAMYNGDVAAFYTKWMRDVREAQSSSGGFSDVSPRLIDRSDGSPAWGDAGVVLTWHMYRMYGDLEIILNNYHSMEKWLGYIGSSNPTFIWKTKVNNNFGDWLSINASTPKEIVSTAYYAYDALLMSYMAKAIGKTSDAEKYRNLHENIAKAFNREFVDKTTGKITGDTQCDYVLALAFRLLPAELIPKAVQHLVDNIKAHDWHLTTGFIGTAYLLPVLSATGHNDIAYKLLLQETYPSWGFTIKNNATTMWERWDGWSKEKGFQDPNMNSFNHYAFGSVGRWMFQYMAGIDTDDQEVGFKKIIIRPHIGPGINSTEASYNSVRGKITSSWNVQGNNFTLLVSIPPNTKATVSLPFLKKKWEKEISSGDYKFSVEI